MTGREQPTTPRAPVLPDAVVMAPLLTPDQVSEYLDVPLGTLANWRYQGRGPAFVRLGRHVRYRATDIAEWISSLLVHEAS